MTPEPEAREEIDDQLHQTGWAVQSADEMDISGARGVAVREFPLETGFADYLLYADCKALGTIEAKPKGHTFSLIQASESQIEASLKRSARLRQSILKRAFESKLVPQDPNDEPASVLLARTKAGRDNTPGRTNTAARTPLPRPSSFRKQQEENE